MSKHGKILVAMSGGIDSSVAAVMLHEEGYEVIGMTMKTWDYTSSNSSKKETGCCSLDSINDARAIAVAKDFPHYVLDIRSEFTGSVINNFVDEYLAGRTPNPCVLCNTHIKWEALLKRADMLECEFIATGHYAQVRKQNNSPTQPPQRGGVANTLATACAEGTLGEVNNRFVISKGIDETKDQSYVLWGLSQECLARTNFPLGKFHKSEIKKMAVDMGFSELAEKSESYEICFVPDNDYRSFLKNRVEGLEQKVANGDFVTTEGKVLGKHSGYPFYTIGQRKGLEIAVGSPLYVTEIIPETNTVVLGNFDELKKQSMMVRDFNLMKYATIDGEKEVLTKIRYKDAGTMSTIQQIDNKLSVMFHAEVRAVASGQSAVFYEGDDVVGGGFIER